MGESSEEYDESALRDSVFRLLGRREQSYQELRRKLIQKRWPNDMVDAVLKDFKEKGGDLEILQLWLNLPSELKMTDPNYVGKQKIDIPSIEMDNGKVEVQLLFGELQDKTGGFQPSFPLFLTTLHFQQGGTFEKAVPSSENIFLYVVRGHVKVQDQEVEMRNLVEFENEDGAVKIEANEDAIVLFGHAKPFDEPIVAQGPFVMNSQQEIMQAFRDYQEGKFGEWED